MADEIHQCDVEFTDGTSTFFVSADGQRFYEHGFPEKGATISPMSYARRYLKDLGRWDKVQSVEFTVREPVRMSELEAT